MCLRRAEPLCSLLFLHRLLATRFAASLIPGAWVEAIWATTRCSGLGFGPSDAYCPVVISWP